MGTRETFTYALRKVSEGLGFGGDIESTDWSSVNARGLHDLVEHWSEKGLAVTTIELYMNSFKALARELYSWRLISADQITDFRRIRPMRGRYNMQGKWKVVERRVRTALLKAASEDPRPQGVRDAALIAVLFGSGLKRTEAVQLRVENVHLEQGTLTLNSIQGSITTLHLAEWALPYLCAWMNFRSARDLPSEGPFFCRIRKGGDLTGTALTGRGVHFICTQVSKLAGLEMPVRPQDARMTVGATIIAEHGVLVGRKALRLSTLNRALCYDQRSEADVGEIIRKSQ
ncbi:hypothetical protein DM872_06680 [Pseudomonas taiwanensis]|nr:hypothetical protein [Pseudomonas taiwanensis]